MTAYRIPLRMSLDQLETTTGHAELAKLKRDELALYEALIPALQPADAARLQRILSSVRAAPAAAAEPARRRPE